MLAQYASMTYFPAVKAWVDASYGDHKARCLHFVKTVTWLETLTEKTPLPEYMAIAAYAHDIERAFSKESLETYKSLPGGYLNPSKLMHHQRKGALLLRDFLDSHNAPQDIINDACDMVTCHEIGGSLEQDLLRDADSLSFLEVNTDTFITKHLPVVGPRLVREKFDWMFQRIGSMEAQSLAKPLYEDAIRNLAAA